MLKLKIHVVYQLFDKHYIFVKYLYGQSFCLVFAVKGLKITKDFFESVVNSFVRFGEYFLEYKLFGKFEKVFGGCLDHFDFQADIKVGHGVLKARAVLEKFEEQTVNEYFDVE